MTDSPKWSDVGAGAEEAVAEARRRNQAYPAVTAWPSGAPLSTFGGAM